MNLLENNVYDLELHNRAILAAQNYNKAEVVLLEILQEIDSNKIFRNFGFTSLFVYATDALRLSEHTAYNLITVARKSKEIPAIKEEIKNGALSISKVRKIIPILNAQNQKMWIEKAKKLTVRELEREVAKSDSELTRLEKIKYISANRVHLSFEISESLYEKIKKAQDYASSKNQKHTTLEYLLDQFCNLYLQRYDPVEKAKRSLMNVKRKKQHQRVIESDSIQSKAPQNKAPIPITTKHQVVIRDQNQCTALDHKNIRCTNKRWLQIHHIQHRNEGGNNDLQNLKTLCFAHHRMVHTK